MNYQTNLYEISGISVGEAVMALMNFSKKKRVLKNASGSLLDALITLHLSNFVTGHCKI
jgi:hypothetical protein